jgi:FkbM family methyltransferase
MAGSASGVMLLFRCVTALILTAPSRSAECGACMPNLTTWRKRIRGSSCPVSTWEDLLAKLLPPAKAPVLVDIGANKGYKVGRFIERWSQTPVTPKRWYGALIASAKTNVGLCGACSDCKEKPLLEHQLARWPSVRVHALELQATTRELLRRVLNDTGTSAAVEVHDLAASDVTQTVEYIEAGPGNEGRFVCTKSSRLCKRGRDLNGTRTTQAITVDDFLARQGLRDVYQLVIDTEGHDALVLEGARQSLAARKISILEFEYSGKGQWGRSKEGLLAATLHWVSALGYCCYWQTGSKERPLMPAAAGCFRPEHEIRAWSNLVCAHGMHAAALRRIADSLDVTTMNVSALDGVTLDLLENETKIKGSIYRTHV